jgi:hypothetical protein
MGIGTRLPGEVRKFDSLGRRVGAGAGNHRNAAGHMFHGGFDQRTVFVVIDRRRFTCSADNDDAVRAFRNVPVEQTLQARQVERAVVLHWRKYGRNGTLYGLHESTRNGMPKAAAS